MTDLLLIILFSIAGLCVGCITGLIPGLHVNTISLLILSSLNVFMLILHPIAGEDSLLILIAVFIVSISITHTFVNIIPATFLPVVPKVGFELLISDKKPQFIDR